MKLTLFTATCISVVLDLVIGHGSTTPSLVELLSGDATTAINEKGEFDRLHTISVRSDGSASSTLFRYREP